MRASLLPLGLVPLPAGAVVASADPTGITGWVAAVASVGLLGPVLYWLCYKHLPAKDDLMKDMLAAKDAQMQQIITSRDDLLREQLGLERNACQDRHRENLELWREEREARQRQHDAQLTEHRQTQRDAQVNRHSLAGLSQTLANLTAIVETLLAASGVKVNLPHPRTPPAPPPEKGAPS